MNRASGCVSLLLLAIFAAPSLGQEQQRRPGLAPGVDPEIDPSGHRRRVIGPVDAAAVVDSASILRAKEDDLIGKDRHARLIPVTPRAASAEHAVILVHGIKSDFETLAPVLARVARETTPFQTYVFAYADWKKRTSLCGRELAEQIRALPAKRVTIIAHSLGGIVTRRALVDLAANGGAERFAEIEVLAVDTPWHGFGGPKDGFMMSFVKPFMPDGLEDMRARSGLFQGVPKSADPAEKAGLYGVALPANVSIRLVFAQHGDAALDWTEKPLDVLPAKIAAHFTTGEAVSGDPRIENEWAALSTSANFPGFERHVRNLPTIDANTVRGALERHFPRLPGDHTSVLSSEELLSRVDRLLRDR